MAKANENVTFRYKFSFENGLTKEFVVNSGWKDAAHSGTAGDLAG